MSKSKREREAPEVGAMALRVIRALVKRAAEGDWEALEQLQVVADVAGNSVGEALTRMHGDHPEPVQVLYSWQQLGVVLGMTRQSAQEKSRKWREAQEAQA